MLSLRLRPVSGRCAAVAGAMGLAVGLAACSDFLTSTKSRSDPSNPQSAAPSNLFTSIQLNVTARQTDVIAQSICIWLQQCAGEVQPYSAIGTYSIADDQYYGPWSEYFGGGGLLDLHTLERLTSAIHDSTYLGQAYVLEALLMGEAADLWGDIPYSQAAQTLKYPHPKLDPQQAVFDSLETLLRTAAVLLQATGPSNQGALSLDAAYGALGLPAQRAAWAALANTLRARYFLHMAKKLGPAMYDSALAAAQTGIASDAGNFVSANQNTAFQANLWFQVMTVYAGNVVAGGAFVNALKAASDPRLQTYFSPADTLGDFVGADPGQFAGPYSSLNPARAAQGFLQPLVTFEENQLIIAEAALQTGQPALALTALNAERTAQGVPTFGSATLQNVMTEKYTVLFQNVEIWSDWRRTGIPALVPYNGGNIPRRLTYPLSERSANPSVPDPGPSRNWNDP